ncbi:Actin-100 [Acropora cervicornis]|uniref:Actin-100 n=1 Tax=Acropora cervicornis TaxID=6130 RepID=A0AAD9UW08_ACRCE|nr:Actin-100 [Acropora cervicornis]
MRNCNQGAFVKSTETEQRVEASNAEAVLESRDALYLQEFSVTGDFIRDTRNFRSSSEGSEEKKTEILAQNDDNEATSFLDDKDVESSQNITPAMRSSVCSESEGKSFTFNECHDDGNKQSVLSKSVGEFDSTSDLAHSPLFALFADKLVTRAKEKALLDIDCECSANNLAERISSDVMGDVMGQLATRPVSREEEVNSPIVQELHSFAGNVVDSLIRGASENVLLINDFDSFAKDLSEEVINDGIKNYAIMEKVRQGKKQKVSLQEINLFSEGIVSEAVSDGIDKVLGQELDNEQVSTALDRNVDDGALISLPQPTGLSLSLQPQIGGVVENIVNKAIYEASLRVKQQNQEQQPSVSTVDSSAQEILHTQVNEMVQEMIVSALQEVASSKVEDENESEMQSCIESFVDKTLDIAINEAAERVSDQQNLSDQNRKYLNGHVDITLEPSLLITNDDQGVDEVPFKPNKNLPELDNEEARVGNNYWRQSLVLDLQENEEEFDESFESGKRSGSGTTDSQLTPEDNEITSHDRDSEEFVDSSEDEVIDHAADAKIGAVGGSNANEDDQGKIDYCDELDDDFSGDGSDDSNDDDDDGIGLEGQTMVDGLCASKPKEKQKRKTKKSNLSSQARIQSDMEGYVLSAKKKLLAGSQYNTAVVLDNGAGVIKLGMAGDKMPTVIEPAVYGIPKRYSLQMAGMDNKRDRLYGSSATAKAGVMQLEYPMSSGFLEKWSDVEDIWDYLLYSELGIEEASHPVIELDIGGQALTDNLQKLLRQNKGHNFNSSSGWQIVNKMKEKMAYVAKDYEAEMEQFKTSDKLTKFYSLPDGQTVVISSEMINTVEPLFDPETLLDADDTIASQIPIHGLVNTAFKRCSADLQNDFCRNVVLSGGTTLTKGLVPRLEHELSRINPKIRSVRAPANRGYSAWIGGSILGSLSSLDNMYATIDEYAEQGARIINQKCF